jgi:hypothetical protein
MNRPTVVLGFGVLAALGSAHRASAQLFVPSEGRPATANDFSGKTICWSNGHVGKYSADGRFENNLGKEGRWFVSDAGVFQAGLKQFEAEVLKDGQVRLHWLVLRSKRNSVRDLWGKYCNASLSAGVQHE